MIRLCVLAALLSLPVVPAVAQPLTTPDGVVASGTSYSIFARPGEETIEVLVVGDAGTGIYVIGRSVTLPELVALQGVGTYRSVPDVKTTVTVRVLRSGSVIYEAEYDEVYIQPAATPTLEESDVVDIGIVTEQKFGWRDTLRVTAALSSVAGLVISLVNILS